MNRTSHLKEQIAAEAADWFVCLQDAGERETLRAEFVEWLLRSPDHVEEFLAISRVWGEAQSASATRFPVDDLIAEALSHAENCNVVALHAASSPRFQSDVSSRAPGKSSTLGSRLRIAAAAAFAFVILGAVTWVVRDQWLNPALIRTAIGEQRSVTLADGSVVDVNTHSELRIDLSDTERKLHLLRGEARFKVARDAKRPFIVSTPEARIRALGTVFNVRAEAQQTAVAVIEGHVEVREVTRAQTATAATSPSHIELKAGQQASVDPAGRIVPNAGPPLERVTEWTSRRLVFREEPLAVVVAEFNRYHSRPIRIETPELAGLRISGTFDSSDPTSLLEYFRRFENVAVDQRDDSILLSTPTPTR